MNNKPRQPTESVSDRKRSKKIEHVLKKKRKSRNNGEAKMYDSW